MKINTNKRDLSVCELSPTISNQIKSQGFAEEEVSPSIVQLSSSMMSSKEIYAREKLQHRLKYNKSEYVVLDNSNQKQSASCWRLFGFPAKLDSNNIPKKIEGYVSCKNCFVTYSYISNSTTFLNKHNCESPHRKNNSTSSSCRTSSSQSLITIYGHSRPKNIRLSESHSKEMKDLLVRWIRKDMRPFTIVIINYA